MKWKILIIILLCITNFGIEKTPSHNEIRYGECKIVMAIGNATAGDYNLLLKVRDPARQGLQVLCIIPKGYEYDYHHPWLGYKMHFVVEKKFIGTTSKQDIPPNITKPGMLLTEAGIALADADTFSYLTNPSVFAWDDFDWMRYAAQEASNEDEAVYLLTKEVVDKMHAPTLAENIFVVGKDKGIIIEADAFNYCIKEIYNGIAIQSNYPKLLWKKHIIYPIFIALNFNFTYLGWVEEGDLVRIGGIAGIRVSKIHSDSIDIKLFPFGYKKEISLGEGKVLGNFWVKLIDIDNNKAKIYMCFKYYEWERKLEEILGKKEGNITEKDLMALSRIHSNDLEGLRLSLIHI